jgi:hypothetical protein
MGLSIVQYVYLTKVSLFRIHVLVRVLFLVLVPASALVHILVRVKLNMALWMFLSDMAIILSIPKGRTRWCRNLKDLSHESV